ncbi:hypothetical protein GF323_01215 [Candidatus Woesearchaeota archaeon]|nr:hypothetical protein [Candidatus Woesearchaeota archaeon]
MKKAQIPGQIFLYIIAIVIVAVILIVGYSSIDMIRERMGQTEKLRFRQNLQSSLNNIANDFGRIEQKEFLLANEYRKVCFIQDYGYSNPGNLDIIFKGYPIIQDTIINGEPTKNTFLLKANNKVAETYMIGNIALIGNAVFECFDVVDSKLSLRIEGKGDHVVIS